MYMLKNLIDGGNRKEATLKSYVSRLKTLNGGKEVDNLAFLYNYDGIIEKIQNYKITTQRNFIIAIVSVLKPIKVMKSNLITFSPHKILKTVTILNLVNFYFSNLFIIISNNCFDI